MRTLIATTIALLTLTLTASAEARLYPVGEAEHPVALAPAHDGGFLISSEFGDVQRVSALGEAKRIATVAGAKDIDEASDGSVLVADGDAEVVRIAPDGTKTTALAGLSEPDGVAALSD